MLGVVTQLSPVCDPRRCNAQLMCRRAQSRLLAQRLQLQAGAAGLLHHHPVYQQIAIRGEDGSGHSLVIPALRAAPHVADKQLFQLALLIPYAALHGFGILKHDAAIYGVSTQPRAATHAATAVTSTP